MNTDIKRIRDIIEKETGINLDIATRKREAVLARRMYYTILKRQTKMSLNDIGATPVSYTHLTLPTKRIV